MAIASWSHVLLWKIALLWAPAAGLLWLLGRRNARSAILYFVSCVTLFCYILWSGTVAVVLSPSFARWSSELKKPDLAFSNIPLLVFIFLPLSATICSFILLIASCWAEPGEHRFLIPANLLMFILWVTSIIAPN